MSDIKHITDAIGCDAIAAALGVTVSAVREQTRLGQYPAAWFVVLRKLGAESGVDVPEAAFRWKVAA